MIKLNKPAVDYLKRDLYPNHPKGKEIHFDRIKFSNSISRLMVRVINLTKKPFYIDSIFLKDGYKKWNLKDIYKTLKNQTKIN